MKFKKEFEKDTGITFTGLLPYDCDIYNKYEESYKEWIEKKLYMCEISKGHMLPKNKVVFFIKDLIKEYDTHDGCDLLHFANKLINRIKDKK